MTLPASIDDRPGDASGPAQVPVTLRSLVPGAQGSSARDFVAALGLPGEGAGGRPRVLVNMVSTVDGHAAADGRTAALSSRGDRELFHALRAGVDGVLVGAQTLRTERYGRLLRDPLERERRRQDGRDAEPLACIVSGRLDLSPELPLLAEPEARVVVLTASGDRLPETAAQVEYVRTPVNGALDLVGALTALHRDHGVHTLLCEGGPHLNGSLLALGLVDELFLSLAPVLLSGPTAPLTICVGPQLAPPAALELISVLEWRSSLFLRYRVSAER